MTVDYKEAVQSFSMPLKTSAFKPYSRPGGDENRLPHLSSICARKATVKSGPQEARFLKSKSALKRTKGKETKTLLQQLQKNASTSRCTYSDRNAKWHAENQTDTFAVDAMIQYNENDQPLTGAIVFGINHNRANPHASACSFSPITGAPSSIDSNSARPGLELPSSTVADDSLGRLLASPFSSATSFAARASYLDASFETRFVPDRLSLFGAEPEAMTTSMPTPPATDRFSASSLCFFDDNSRNLYDDAIDGFFNEQNRTLNLVAVMENDVILDGDDELSLPPELSFEFGPPSAKRKRAESPMLETEFLLFHHHDRHQTTIHSQSSSPC